MNEKIKPLEVILLFLYILLAIMSSSIKHYISLHQRFLYLSINGLFYAVAVLSVIYIVRAFLKKRIIPSSLIRETAIIVKSNFIFFVLSYLLFFLVFPRIYNHHMEVLTNLFDAIANGRKSTRITTIIEMIIIAPVVEELLFRKLFFRVLRKIKLNWIILLSSVIFMICHDIADFSKFVVGVGLSRVYIKYGRIELSMLIHSIINIAALLIGLLSFSLIPGIDKNSMLLILPLVFVLPNYEFWIEKLFIEKKQEIASLNSDD